ncbi:hypothetical protein G6F65_012795 [Rhizopus arrhizus]|nr:hypothetical protein G6F65_012795 [Rhizopus arrhizus]
MLPYPVAWNAQPGLESPPGRLAPSGPRPGGRESLGLLQFRGGQQHRQVSVMRYHARLPGRHAYQQVLARQRAGAPYQAVAVRPVLAGTIPHLGRVDPDRRAHAPAFRIRLQLVVVAGLGGLH